jgi:hypothetical protein
VPSIAGIELKKSQPPSHLISIALAAVAIWDLYNDGEYLSKTVDYVLLGVVGFILLFIS